MSEIVPVATALIALIGTMFTGIMAYLMAKLNQKQAVAAVKAEEVAIKVDEAAVKADAWLDEDRLANAAAAVKADAVAIKVEEVAVKAAEAAVKVEEVKNSLEANTAMTDANCKIADATSALVSSNMGLQLKIGAIALRRLANITKDPEDIAAADTADLLLKEHALRQSIIDKIVS